MSLADYILVSNSQTKDNLIPQYYNYLNNEYLLLNDKFNNQLNYRIIKKIPILILISFIVSLILIYYSSYNNNKILDKVCNFSIGLTIMIVGVYLLTFRFEFRKKLNSYNKNKKLLSLLLNNMPKNELKELQLLI